MSLIKRFSRRGKEIPEGAEMSFVDHIDVLRWHIIRSAIAILICGIVVFFKIEWIFDNVILGPAHKDFVFYRVLCRLGNLWHIDALCMDDLQLKFQATQLSAQFMLSFTASFTIGFVLAFPYVFWEFWRFLKPAMKPTELKYAKGIVFWSSILFFTGVAFAYFVLVPFTVNFFGSYQLSPLFENRPTIDSYYDTLSDLCMGLGLVFELPIVVFFLSRIGILTPKLMREKRRFAILIIVVISAVITPPDWLSIWLVAIPLIGLYEASITISARAEKARGLRRATDMYDY